MGLDKIAFQYSAPFITALRWMLSPYQNVRPQSADDVLAVILEGRSPVSVHRSQSFATRIPTTPPPSYNTTNGVSQDAATQLAPGVAPSNLGVAQASPPSLQFGAGGPPSSASPAYPHAYPPPHHPATNAPQMPPQEPIKGDVVSRAEAALTEYLGPIAKVIVRRAAQDTFEEKMFLNKLADELETEDERRGFLKAAKAGW